MKNRAKMRYKGREIHLGYFDSKAEVSAACAAARKALERWEEFNGEGHRCPAPPSPPPPPKQMLPHPDRLIEVIEQGLYDIWIPDIALAAAGRSRFVKALKKTLGFGGYGVLNDEPLQKSLGLDPPAHLIR
jgi:hypothetical protein